MLRQREHWQTGQWTCRNVGELRSILHRRIVIGQQYTSDKNQMIKWKDHACVQSHNDKTKHEDLVMTTQTDTRPEVNTKDARTENDAMFY